MVDSMILIELIEGERHVRHDSNPKQDTGYRFGFQDPRKHSLLQDSPFSRQKRYPSNIQDPLP